MPTYTFLNKKTKEIETVVLKITEYDGFKANNIHLERYHDTAPTVCYNGRYFGSLDAQTDNGFKEVLAKIGENYPDSPVGQKYRKNKTVKEAKTREIVNKHVEIARQKAADRDRRNK